VKAIGRDRACPRAGAGSVKPWAIAIGTACAILTVPAAASAHAVLVASQPGAQERVERAPLMVTLTFDEPVETSVGSLRVFDSKGDSHATGPVFHPGGDPRSIAARVGKLQRGRFVVSWQVVSADSHIETPLPREAAGLTSATASFSVRDVTVRVIATQTNARHWALRIDGVENRAGVTLRDADRKSGPLVVPLARDSSGGFAGDAALPWRGAWSALVSARCGEFDENHRTLSLTEKRP
jgi:methionine-rich copper-binding protein CopC